MKGVCPECAGRIGISHQICDGHEVGESGLCPNCDTRYEVWTRYECEYCRYSRRSIMWFAALNHPAVIAFLYRHGLNETIPIRKLTWDNLDFVRGITETVLETDPYRFQVVVSVGDDALVVVANEDLDVLEVRREANEDGG